MGNMTTMQKVYFITAWCLVGGITLAMIIEAVGLGAFMKYAPLFATSQALDIIYIGITAVFCLFYLSGWFTNSLVLFILAWVVGGLALLSMILMMAANLHPTYTAGTFFLHISFGVFCTLLLIRCSGKFQ
jgi:hypothetical protein